MHAPEVKAAAMKLIESGLNDCEVSRRTGIPRGTIRDWRRPTYISRSARRTGSVCPRCWQASRPMWFTQGDYCELLGLYLGDGFLSRHPRAVRLRITLDAKYPVLIEETRRLLQRSMPANRIDVDRNGTTGSCVNVSAYSKHWPCLLPQHGFGKKHERRIRLEPWQERLLVRAPWEFLRGCIRSDGCAFVNRTDIHRPQPYEYLSYDFSNKSKDIVDLFIEACDLVGLEYRATHNEKRALWVVRINRRESVARMLDRVGLKH